MHAVGNQAEVTNFPQKPKKDQIIVITRAFASLQASRSILEFPDFPQRPAHSHVLKRKSTGEKN